MLELSNLTAQRLEPGQAITFDKVLLQCGCGECFNQQLPKTAKLCMTGRTYRLSFHGNITSETAGAQLQLAMAIGGQPLVETAMNSTPSAANALNNVSAGTFYKNTCCDTDRISVVNTGANPITIAPNSSFQIEVVK